MQLDQLDDFDIPDLDELSIEDAADIPDAEDSDIPAIDLENLDNEMITDPEESFDMDDISSDEIDIEPFGDETAPSDSESSPLDELDSFDEDAFDDIPDMDDSIEDHVTSEEKTPVSINLEEDLEIDSLTDADLDHDSGFSDFDDDSLTIEPLDDDILNDDKIIDASEPTQSETGEETELELTDKELAKLKKAIILFNAGVRQAIKDTVINDRLSPGDTRRLIDMILTGKPEDNIHKFLEKRLNKKINLIDETKVSRRKIITARPEYTLEGRERQKRLLKITKIFGASTIAAFFITILSYQFMYKPYMAKKLIHKGVEIIVNSGVAGGRFDRRKKYDEAEKLFQEVDRDYKKDYIYGYNEYARAYLENKDYAQSLDKLNRAYVLDRTDKDTLNNLGYFYARIEKEYFNSLKPQLGRWYFAEKKDLSNIKTSLDLSINFYRRVLLLDNKNISALLGIGNAYFYQGQYVQAKKYYENILMVNKKSIVGYSGLLNLFIERDAFPLTATLHAEIRERGLLPELPSPLLSKLAGYYLSKRARGDSNIRIDYGATTPRLKDQNDNTYPAVREVLKALNQRDPDYPQLQIQYAKLHMAQNNLMVMKRYIDKALSLSPDYFSALHLMGEYYYRTKEPVQSYKFLKRAVEKYGNQPKFTRADFYSETESIGSTNTYLGNIFYYYFDKVKSRKGALDDEMAENEVEKMANYVIAREYYVKAANMGYDSSELNYNLGRIYYLNKNYTMALDRWLHLYDDFVKSPEIMLSVGNALYHRSTYDSSKGEFLKLISVMEYEAEKINTVDPARKSHIKLFQTLSSAYNNLGAVYQNLQDYEKRDLAYWKSIDYSRRLGRENEYGRVNLARSHRNAEPILDEGIPYSIDIYSEDMRE